MGRWSNGLGRRGAGILLGAFVVSPSLAQPTSDDGVVRFAYPDTSARAVSLAGEFNGWSQTATPLDREGPVWVTRVFLDPGTYEYSFVVDGAWQPDPGNPETSAKGHSVVRVGPDGSVQPPRPSAASAAGDSAGGPSNVGLSLRYLGFVTSRRDPKLGRYDLERPLHDIDVRFEARVSVDLSGWFLASLTNRGPGEPESQLSLRYDRGQIEWIPGTSRLLLFDNVAAAHFGDPAGLVGGIGIYADDFGYGRRGLGWRQRILGAPVEIVYADDTEPEPNTVPEPGIPDVGAPPPPGTRLVRYTTSSSHRGADALAVRLRAGTDDLGLGIGARLDRGARRGTYVDLVTQTALGDTLQATGTVHETAERWEALALDARGRFRDLRLFAEYLGGRRTAEAVSVAPIDIAGPADSLDTSLGEPTSSGTRFDLDHSHRALVEVRTTRDPRKATWGTRPGTGRLDGLRIGYDYEEHDFTALVTGEPFLMRRHGLRLGADTRLADTDLRLDVEQHWFRYPQAATWETQFWFRRQNAWLDEDVTSVERMTLLAVPTASVVRLHAARLLWPERAITGELHLTGAAPGLDHAPRYFEGVLRLGIPLHGKWELRTHSRLAVYRQFETTDPAVVAALGPGKHFEAGEIPFTGGYPVENSYRALSAHFVELVYAVTPRSDVALGFGVDPFVVYEVTNEYEAIGWDEFLFANGASPADALAHPVDWGRELEAAESALERERRVVLEARLRF